MGILKGKVKLVMGDGRVLHVKLRMGDRMEPIHEGDLVFMDWLEQRGVDPDAYRTVAHRVRKGMPKGKRCEVCKHKAVHWISHFFDDSANGLSEAWVDAVHKHEGYPKFSRLKKDYDL